MAEEGQSMAVYEVADAWEDYYPLPFASYGTNFKQRHS